MVDLATNPSNSTDPVGTPWLEVRNLDAWRGAAHIVQGVSLELANRRVVIVGRNGMGKTTFCEALSGMLDTVAGARRSGEVVLDGADLHAQPPHRVSRRGLGYVPQGRRVFRSLTAQENLKVAQRADATWGRERVYELFRGWRIDATWRQEFSPVVSNRCSPSVEPWWPAQSCCSWTSRLRASLPPWSTF
jgi:ABC-type multidrug transport system ATPase subunit